MHVCALLLVSLTVSSQAEQASAHDGWSLTWSDEFNGPESAPPDHVKWSFETGGNGFGNQELETYTGRRVNARPHDGNLVITARKESATRRTANNRGIKSNGRPRHA